MKRNIFAFTLAAAILVPAVSQAQMIEKQRRWRNNTIKQYRTELLTTPVVFVHTAPDKLNRYERGSVYTQSTGAGFCGRFQRPHQHWDAKTLIGKQLANWNIKSADGSVAHAGVTYDVIDGKGAKKVLRVEVMQFKEFPNWVFYRYSGCVPGQMSFACPALRVQVQTKYIRSLWIAWDGGKAECGDHAAVPWFGKNTQKIDAFAVYSRGGGSEPKECDMAVWIPEQYSNIWAQRFKKNDDRITLYYRNIKGEYTFALGSRVTESGEKINAPAFLKKERHIIAKKLRSIDWTVKVDIKAIQKKYDEVKKLAANKPEAKELPKLLADIKSGDAIRACGAEGRLDAMMKKLEAGKLDDLFD